LGYFNAKILGIAPLNNNNNVQ